MDTIMRSVVMYAFLLVVLRVAGKRTFSDITPFEFVLLLVIGEATAQALLGDDFSITNAFIVILTLTAIDVGLSLVKQRWPQSEKFTEGLPVILVDNGEVLADHLKKTRVDEPDIMEAARRMHGLERLDQVKYAVLEKSGGISIIPKQ